MSAFIPTGYEALDLALGGGLAPTGWPRGRVVELFGPDADVMAKIALAAVCGVSAAAWVSVGGGVHNEAAKEAGASPVHCMASAPPGAVLAAVEKMVSDWFGIIVVDAVQALGERRPCESNRQDVEAEKLSRLLSASLRRITATSHRTGTAVLLMNQLHQQVGPPCSNALKYYASVRVDVRRAEGGVRCKVVKNKMAAPFQTALISTGATAGTPVIVEHSRAVLRVPSQTRPGVVYTVADAAGAVTCTCPGFEHRGECKHALAYRAARLALDEPALTAVEALTKARVPR